MAGVISRRSVLLMFSDIMVIYSSFVFSKFLYFGLFNLHIPLFNLGLVCGLYLLIGHIFDYYSPFRYFRAPAVLAEVLVIVLIPFGCMTVLFYFFPHFRIPGVLFLSENLFIYAGLIFVRLIYNELLGSRITQTRTLIIGDGLWLKEMAVLLEKTVYTTINVVGVAVPENIENKLKDIGDTPILGTISDIKGIIDREKIGCVILAMEEKTRSMENEIIATLYEKDVHILSSLNIYEQITGQVPYHYYRGGHFLSLAEQIGSNFYLMFKRFFDIIGALLIGLVFSPVLIIVMFLLSMEFRSFSKVIFSQERIGKGGKMFTIYKLRTMMDMPDGQKAVTRVGQWVRKFRIDEVPQFINILKGQMSLIGPRPEMPYFVAYCRKTIPFYNVIFSVRPGLTGWPQVRFKHTANLEDYQTKFSYDLYYLKYCSITLDIIILFESVKVVLFGRGK